MSRLVGQTLGQYHIVQQIGRGGMGAVYKAYQPSLERHVALKVLLPTLVEHPELRERFQREARAIASLNHPNILPVYDFGSQDEYMYLAMRYIEGGHTLKQMMSKPLTLEETTLLIEQVAAALESAHRHGIIHRDVKPANVLMDGNWALLSDFGLVKLLESSAELTSPGAGMGTPAYVSPEQSQGRAVDHRTDVYALGVILFQMVTGRLPHDANTPLGIILKRARELPPMPRQFNPQLPEAIDQIILKALAPNPNERFQSAAELAKALKLALKNLAPGVELEAAFRLSDLPTALTFPTPRARAAAGNPDVPQWSSPPGSPLSIPPPPKATRPSLSPYFVGREAELAAYAQQLATVHLAIITGMAGVGKTSLAIRLAQQRAKPEKIFWHTLHKDEGVDAIIWSLAAFLARRQRTELWEMLQSARLTGGQPPPLELLIDYVLQAVRGQGFLICLDDLHHLQDDPSLMTLLKRLWVVAQTGEVAMIITSRYVIDLAPALPFGSLGGLNRTDTEQLLQQHGLSFPADLVTELHQDTGGNAELLMLAIDLLKQAGRPEQVLVRLAATDDVERYLVREIDDHLSEDDREIMIGVAILLGYPGSRQAIETITGRSRIKQLLRRLADKYLLIIYKETKEETFGEHAILQAFYYDVPSKRERQEMHRQAAEYYETEEPDPLRAALHYEQAGAYGQAAQIVTADVWAFVNEGQARLARQLLERFQPDQLKAELWVKTKLALGEIYVWLGEYQAAQAAFREALDQLSRLPGGASHDLEARICQGMGSALRFESTPEALAWLRRGLSQLAGADPRHEAVLLIEMGRYLVDLGDYDEALEVLGRALQQLPDIPSRLRATAFLNLGNIYAARGNLSLSEAHTQQALEISEALHDYFRIVTIWQNMGIDAEMTGRWGEAQARYQQALDLALQLGSIERRVALTLDQGILLMKQGQAEGAKNFLEKCLSLARRHHLKLYLLSGQLSLAEWYLRQGQPEAAEPRLVEAEQLAQELEARESLPELHRTWASFYLMTANFPAALSSAERSLEVALTLEIKGEAAITQRVLGQIQLQLNQLEAAQNAFEQSLSPLIELNPYEAARTQAVWGHYLHSGPDRSQGQQLLKAAQATFQRLGVLPSSVEWIEWWGAAQDDETVVDLSHQ